MIRHITSKRAIRIVGWIFITLITLTVLLYVWTNWSGRRRWAATKAMIEREGETLDFRKLLPQAPPDAENLLAIEPLRGITEVVGNDPSKGEPGAKRSVLAAMSWAGSSPAARGVTLGKATDMEEWAKFLRDTKFIDLPANSSMPGHDVLIALDAKFPLIKQLVDEVPRRKRAMFTPALRDREMPDLIFTLSLAHYSGVQNLARLLNLRARAAVHAKNGIEAAHSIITANRIARAFEQEPLLIGLLVGGAIDSMTLESLWLGLRGHVFAETELRQLQELHAPDEVPQALLQAMRGELAFGMDALEYLQEVSAGRKAGGDELAAGLADEGRSLGVNTYGLLPNGLFDHWKSVVGEVELRYLILPLKQGIAAATRAGEALDQEIKGKRNFVLYPDWIMVHLTVPAMKQVSLTAMMVSARKRQAQTAVALERFFAKQEAYPARLNDLVPEFLPSVPLDPCDGKPMRYRTTDTGHFVLWSVGFDGKDDAGKVTVEANSTPKLNKREYLGDWTWQYEPVKTGSEE